MRVVVDATAIPAERLGVGVYVAGLLSAVDPSVDLHVFVKRADAADLGVLIPRATLHPVHVKTRPARIAWMNTLLPLRVRRLRPDVFHGPHYEVPAGLPCPSVVTFHDPTFFTIPEVHERAKVEYFTRVARAGVRRAARVIAVSDYAAHGAIDYAGAVARRVVVVHEGIDLSQYSPAPYLEAADPPYIFFVGALAPHKDVPSLIAAFDGLDVPHELVIAGPRAWGADAVDEAIASATKTSIRCVGYVSEDEKIRLMRNASAFVYPSIAEGFGLPVLEAMACGAPVVTTTGSAPEEFATGAALLVPPRDVLALREALRSVLTDDAVAASLRERGPRRARDFTWKVAADATVDVWRSVASKGT